MGFESIVGQEALKTYLKRAIESGEVSHAYIIEGPRGSGKKTIARAFAQEAGAEGADLIEVSHEKPGSFGVDDVRNGVNATIFMKPIYSEKKVYILPDASMMTVQAQNALLKTFEEPPEYALILLLCDNTEVMLDTIRSRAVTLGIRPLHEDIVRSFLMEKKGASREAAAKAAAFCGGSIGTALELLEDSRFVSVVESVVTMMKGRGSMGWAEITDRVKEFEKEESDRVCALALMWLRDVLVSKAAMDAGQSGEVKLIFESERAFIEQQAGRMDYRSISRGIDNCSLTADRISAAVSPQLSLDCLFDGF